MTYDEHCKRLDALAWPGMEALDNGDKDAALLYIAAMVDYLLRHGFAALQRGRQGME